MNLALFLTGGYDTIALTLSYSIYTMAFLPEQQQKLFAEVDEFFPHDSDVNILSESANESILTTFI